MTVAFVPDVPAARADFDFDLVARALRPVLMHDAGQAVVLGVHGPWGSGKTTLIEALRTEVARRSAVGRCIFVDFNAWKFHEREVLWRALILRLIAELRSHAKDLRKLDELEESLYRAFVVEEKGPVRVNWRAVVTELVTIGLTVVQLDFVARPLRAMLSRALGAVGDRLVGRKEPADEGGLLDKEHVEELGKLLERTTVDRHVNQVQSTEQFLARFRDLVAQLTDDGKRLYVFIDDLDRCLPEAALDIFESIKLFLDAPGCAFVVALDREVIRKGLHLRYGAGDLIDPDQYIEKTISLSYDLPRLSAADALRIVDGFRVPYKWSQAQKELLMAGLGVNPRRIKRFMNTLVAQLRLARLAEARGRPVPACLLLKGDAAAVTRYLKLLLISYRYSGLFSLAVDDPDILDRLQEFAPKTRRFYDKLEAFPPVVRRFQFDEPFWQLMSAGPSFAERPEETRDLMNWFRRTGSTG